MKLNKLELLKNSRFAMGLALLILALGAGSLIAKEANRTVYVWASATELAPGNIISADDLQQVSVLLPESAKSYISATAQVVGAVVTHRIGVGELLPVSAISLEPNSLDQRAVPLTLELTDIPIGLSRGEVIDLYAVPNLTQKSITEPALIIEQITVAAVSDKNNSGKAVVVVNLPQSILLTALTHLSDSRLLIVRSHY
ncbi:MAG: flagellar basal body P-ring biosynthesis protein [Actinobacteria bacterium]|nr:flagellar basal body P-ring biosynthesis protein [Actinomycetota bacterium]MTA98209.1 flagellar basal body P-ring biosynthesis protein [Actinomycetota bacterium]